MILVHSFSLYALISSSSLSSHTPIFSLFKVLSNARIFSLKFGVACSVLPLTIPLSISYNTIFYL